MAIPKRTAVLAATEIGLWLKDLSLCDHFELASSEWLLPEARAIGTYLKILMKRKGVCHLFAPASRILCYSGPRKYVDRACRKVTVDPNHDRAIYLADHGLYTLLERTSMGQHLDNYVKREPDPLKRTLYGFLKSIYVTEKIDVNIREEQKKRAQKQGDLLMGFVSAAYIFTSRDHVETVVAGASFEKVFYLFELPALMLNPEIKTINAVSADRFRKIYFSGHPNAAYETYKMICESEVALFKKRAKAAGKGTPSWQLWKEQHAVWQADLSQFRAVSVFRGILSKKALCAGAGVA